MATQQRSEDLLTMAVLEGTHSVCLRWEKNALSVHTLNSQRTKGLFPFFRKESPLSASLKEGHQFEQSEEVPPTRKI